MITVCWFTHRPKFVHFVYLFFHRLMKNDTSHDSAQCFSARTSEKQTISSDFVIWYHFLTIFLSIGEYRNRMYDWNWKWNKELLHLLQFRFNVIEQTSLLEPKSIGIAFEMHDDNLYFQHISGLNVAHCDGNALECVCFRLFGTLSDETHKCFFQVATDLFI